MERTITQPHADQDQASSPNTLTLPRRVLQVLATLGWEPADRIVDTASKYFDTAVGEKAAVAYVRVNDKDKICLLTGEYQSEGRNALSTTFSFIPVDADEAAIEQAVVKWAEEPDEPVGETYAMRLMDSPRMCG